MQMRRQPVQMQGTTSLGKEKSKGGANKKAIERPGLLEDEIEELRKAFEMFDTDNSGRIDSKELKAAMQGLGFESKNPIIFQMFIDLEKEGGSSIDFETFLNAMTGRLGDKESESGVRGIFDLFDDGNSINIKNLKTVANDLLGENLSEYELKEIIEKYASDGQEITFDDFYSLMSKKDF